MKLYVVCRGDLEKASLFRLEHKRRHGKVGKKRHLPKVNENWPVAEEWEISIGIGSVTPNDGTTD